MFTKVFDMEFIDVHFFLANIQSYSDAKLN